MGQAETKGARGTMKRWQKVALGVAGGLLLLAAGLVVVCWFVGIRSKVDLVVYRELWREHHHPVWKDLALRRFGRGDPLDGLLERHVPTKREDVPPFTRLAYYRRGLYRGEVIMIARDDRLVAARADTRSGRHVFFHDAERMRTFARMYQEFTRQRRMETEAYPIHRAVRCGQDVFLSRRVERSGVVARSQAVTRARTDEDRSEEELKPLMEELNETYLQAVFARGERLIAEVNEVYCGDLERGAVLAFSGDRCRKEDLEEADVVFVHFEDGRMFRPWERDEALYLTVPKRALDWYQSRTPAWGGMCSSTTWKGCWSLDRPTRNTRNRSRRRWTLCASVARCARGGTSFWGGACFATGSPTHPLSAAL